MPRFALSLMSGLVAIACVGTSCEKSAKSGDDDTPPEVESTVPSNGDMASVSVVLSATFSEEMDLATVTENTFRLTSGGTLVPGTVASDTSALTVTFTPTSALSAGAGYTAQILADAADVAGNTLESAYSWSFTTSSGEFVLSSSAIAPGAVFPATYTCDGLETVNPPLAWTAGPGGTASYAMIFKDLTNMGHHWAIWDIPGATLALAQGVPNDPNPNPPGSGTKQNISQFASTYGYYGPCPPSEHTYRFTLYAIDVATLANVTTGSTGAQVEAEILLHDLGTATLTGTYAP